MDKSTGLLICRLGETEVLLAHCVGVVHGVRLKAG
jgi:hypothetical protein